MNDTVTVTVVSITRTTKNGPFENQPFRRAKHVVFRERERLHLVLVVMSRPHTDAPKASQRTGTDGSTLDTVAEVDLASTTATDHSLEVVPVSTPIAPDLVSIGLRLLVDGLVPYVENRLQRVYGDRWMTVARDSFRDRNGTASRITWDAHSILAVMWDQWNAVFRHELGHSERSYVSELRDVRNRWAHQQRLDFHDTFRVLDSIRRLLSAIDSPSLSAIERLQQQVLESHVGEQVNLELQTVASARNKWWTVALYVACCTVIMVQLVASPLSGLSGTAMTGLVLFVLLVFCYLIYQQFKMEPALLYGPHECNRCRKIIYRKSCPYCD